MTTMTVPSKKTSSAATSPKSFDLMGYFKGVKAEWGKITWPTKLQVWQQTITVLVMVAFLTFLIWLIDLTLHTVVMMVMPKPPGMQ